MPDAFQSVSSPRSFCLSVSGAVAPSALIILIKNDQSLPLGSLTRALLSRQVHESTGADEIKHSSPQLAVQTKDETASLVSHSSDVSKQALK